MEWKKLGTVDVDAGLIWIGDPCYILHKSDKEPVPDLGASWSEFCERLHQREKASGVHGVAQWSHRDGDSSANGLGITVGSGWGDGTYDVYGIVNNEGRVLASLIVFDEKAAARFDLPNAYEEQDDDDDDDD